MKNILIAAFVLAGFNLAGQTDQPVSEEIQSEITTAKFKTSAECSMCKKRIEKALGDIDGITYSNLNVPTKILKVKFDPEKLDEEQIRKIVSSVGYDADDVEADPVAYKKLPDCCQKGGMSNHR